jgi:hypothetical protein
MSASVSSGESRKPLAMPSLDAASSAPYAISTNAGTVTPKVLQSIVAAPEDSGCW